MKSFLLSACLIVALTGTAIANPVRGSADEGIRDRSVLTEQFNSDSFAGCKSHRRGQAAHLCGSLAELEKQKTKFKDKFVADKVKIKRSDEIKDKTKLVSKSCTEASGKSVADVSKSKAKSKSKNTPRS